MNSNNVLEDCEKVFSVIGSIDSLIEKIYPEERQIETVNNLQLMVMVLIDQTDALKKDIMSLCAGR